jgi:hypothetical protein
VGRDSQPCCTGEFVSLSYDVYRGGEISALTHVSNRLNSATPLYLLLVTKHLDEDNDGYIGPWMKGACA